MKNKRNMIVAVLILLVGMSAWYFWDVTDRTIEDSQIKQVIEQAAKPIHSNKAAKQASSDSNPPPPTEKSLLKKIAANPQMKKLMEFGKAKNSHVYFYGKVIDQHGKAVPNAKVYFSVSRWGYLTSNGYFYDTSTGADGRFAIEGIEGFSFSVDNIEKQSYEFGGGSIDFRGYQRYAGLAPNDPRRSRLWTETSEVKPVIFNMWKKAEAEPLVHDILEVGYRPDGKFYRVRLKGVEEQLKISFIVDPKGTNSNSLDWSMKLKVIDGGLIESTDKFMNEAPLGGYMSNLSYEYKKDNKDFSDDIRKKFYLKARNGQVYGRLECRIHPYYNDIVAVDIKYWINTNGSRNLQYDPKKRIYPK